MKHILFFVLSLTAVAFSCSSVKKAGSSAIAQGITGYITETKGNRMPMKDAPKNSGRPVLTNVLIYEPTSLDQVSRVGTSALYTSIHTKLVASVATDSAGHYTVALPPGNYSVFIERGKQFYANLFDLNNNIALFRVEENKLTTANLVVSEGASY